jgi:hypothetical protein
MNHLTVQQLSSALDGALGGPSLELVVRHLARCHECRDRQARLARFDDALRRLLAQDPHEFFLEDLGRRSESIVVAVARGLPVPPMVTSIPLIDDEDPYEAMEPPPEVRPELGRAAELARHAGFGRIGMKPTAPAQAPAADPEQAQRMLEALSSGDTADFEELTARDLGAGDAAGGVGEAEAEEGPDGPVFDLPAWVKEGAPRRRATPRPRVVRAIPKLQMMFERLDERAANLSRGAVEEVFRQEPGAEEEDATSQAPPAEATWGAAPSQEPTAFHPSPASSPPAVRPVPSAAILDGPVWTGDGLGAGEPLPRVHADPVTDAYELVEEPRDATPPDGDASEEDPRRRGRRVGRADAAYPPRPAGRSRRMPLAVALTSVAALAALVIVLQLAPSDTPDAGSTAGRAPSLPRVEFVGLDSSETPSLPATGADLRLATTPAPVESLVATPLSPPGAAPADSGRATPPADSLGRNPGR